MDVRLKIGQRLIAGFPGTSLDEGFRRLVRDYKVGNVILFRRNIVSSAQLRELCASIQALVREETGYPAFITIDQEGGPVSRLPPDMTTVPGAMALAATGQREYARECGLITGRELLSLGVNFDLAPVMDVNSNPDNPVIGVRSYGGDPETVASFGTAMLEGLLEAGVLAAAKHFPGHGDTREDSHLSLPEVSKSRAELEAMELRPFVAAIKAGIPAVMTSHILFPALEARRLPATMSRTIVRGLLRGELGFDGLVLSDCMEMNAIKEYYGTVEGTVAAMAAGVDLVFISHTATLAAQAASALAVACSEGRLDAGEMDEAVRRILSFKDQYLGVQARPLADREWAEHRSRSEAILDQTIAAVNLPAGGQPDLGASPWFVGCEPFLTSRVSDNLGEHPSFSRFLADRFGGVASETSIDPETAEIEALLPLARGRSCVVVGTYNGHLKGGQLDLLRALGKTGLPIVAVALRNPYDLRGLDPSICSYAAFEYSPQSLRAVARVLGKERVATGTLPVSWT